MSVVHPPPSAEDQLAFLAKLQRLFAEGDFTATYKFALLIALADISVEQGPRDGSSFQLNIRQLAERFIALYWQHVLPYGAGREDTGPGILLQNMGTQAAIVEAIRAFRARCSANGVGQARADGNFNSLVTTVARTVSDQPLKYLQNFGGGTDQFLYQRTGPGQVTLRPGVAYCLRQFYSLIEQLCRTGWTEHIKVNKRNQTILGDSGGLEDFLFGTTRQSLAIIGSSLRKLFGPTCFYCGKGLTEHDVDHFVPFARYPRDHVENFVLAHQTCNRSKSDTLAAHRHLERWLERMDAKRPLIEEIGAESGITSDPKTMHRVAHWAYSTAAASAGRAWIAPSDFEPIDQRYLALLE